MTKLVFVYGTLKSGFWNNRLFGETSRLVGEGVTLEKGLLTDCGFPFFVPEPFVMAHLQDQVKPILGEVWEVVSDSVIESLDRLEGVGNGFYEHHPVRIAIVGGKRIVDAVAYAIKGDHAQGYDTCGTVTFGEEEVYQWTRTN